MGYGNPTKINQAINAVNKTLQYMNSDVMVGLVTFDTVAEVLIALQPLNHEKIKKEIETLTLRGASCIAAGLVKAMEVLKGADKGNVLLLTDGRANLSGDHMGGFEGSISLDKELLDIAEEAKLNKVIIHTVALGEDAFTGTLGAISEKTIGTFWLGEDYVGLRTQSKKQPPNVSEKRLMEVHVVPVELPSAQPTWTKESQFMHVAIVSERLFQAYQKSCRAFLVNPVNGKKARTALISIGSENLTQYKERRPKTAEKVKAEEAILLDRSYRDYLNLKTNSSVKLTIY
jgi:hypothetical protein